VFKSRVLRIFGPKRDRVVGGLRRLHNEKLHNLYAAPNTLKVIKLRRMRLAGHVACIGEMRYAYKILTENLKGRDHAEDVDLNVNIILEWILG
jgi:hypothetical protein